MKISYGYNNKLYPKYMILYILRPQSVDMRNYKKCVKCFLYLKS